MRIFIIANYSSVPGEKSELRFSYLADRLADKGHDVTLITSSFSHRLKKHRDEVAVNDILSGKYKVKLIKESGYKKHVGLGRILSIRRFGVNLGEELKRVKELPDLIYFSFPTFYSAHVCLRFAKKFGIPAIIDIQDLWPEALQVVLKLPDFLFKILFYPFVLKADRIYKESNAIIGVSESFVERANKVNSTVSTLSVYIGVDLKNFNNYEYSRIKPEGELWMIYIGGISHSYDLKTVFAALNILVHERGMDHLRVKILGTGPQKEQLEQITASLNIPVEFTGLLKYPEMVNYLKNSDIALNAIVKDSKSSITNKFGDFVAAGLPILSSSENMELKKLILKNKIGLNYLAGDAIELSVKIETLIKNKDKMNQFSKNSRRLAEEKFDRRKSYDKIIDVIENVRNEFVK